MCTCVCVCECATARWVSRELECMSVCEREDICECVYLFM